jgi:hypothetical protein
MDGDAHKILILKEYFKIRHLATKILIFTDAPLFYHYLIKKTDNPCLVADLGIFPTRANFCRAAKYGNLKILKWMYGLFKAQNMQDNIKADGYLAFMLILKKNHLNAAKWIHAKYEKLKYKINYYNLSFTILHTADISILDWYLNICRKKNIVEKIFNPETMRYPKLRLLKWLKSNNIPIAPKWFENYVCSDKLLRIKWLYANCDNIKCPDKIAIMEIINNGWLETVKWVDEHFNNEISKFAAINLRLVLKTNYLDIVMYFLGKIVAHKKIFLSENPEIFQYAAESKNPEILKYVAKFFTPSFLF